MLSGVTESHVKLEAYMTCTPSALLNAINSKSFFWKIESTVVFCLILLVTYPAELCSFLGSFSLSHLANEK